MDNVVQNINIEDIISSNFQPSLEEQKKIEELAQLVKTFGLIDPILVRTKNGKYEIILGAEKYEAAKLAGLNNVPVIIKEVDDDTFFKYHNIEEKVSSASKDEEILQNTFKIPLEKSNNNNLSTDSWKFKNSNNNSDVINLSELSKEEYERDDFNMNNEQLNTNMINNNSEQPTPVQQPNQGPTFGGRFFPSLEDEPTNMNMMGNVSQSTNMNEIQNLSNNNNNLIDLTDLSVDKEQVVPGTSSFEIPNLNNITQDMNPSMNNMAIPQVDLSIQNQMPSSEMTMPQTDNIINLENLQNNNPNIQQPIEPMPNMDINNDFLNQQSMNSQLDIPTNIAPQPEIVPPINEMVPPQVDGGINNPTMIQQPEIIQPINEMVLPQVDGGTNNPTITQQPEMIQPINEMVLPQVDGGINNPTMIQQPEFQDMPSTSVQTPVEPVSMDILNTDFGVPTSMNNFTIATEMVEGQNQILPQPVTNTKKDIIPVTNLIKNLIISLESFGYKININEEELTNTVKLTIEVEK